MSRRWSGANYAMGTRQRGPAGERQLTKREQRIQAWMEKTGKEIKAELAAKEAERAAKETLPEDKGDC